jgi:drug/metabolite transporter (DMT)-like permease
MDSADAPHRNLGRCVGSGTVSTALAYVLYFRVLAAAGATNLLLVTFLIPVSAILLGALVLGELLLPRHFLGMALIGLGLMFIDGRLPRRSPRGLPCKILDLCTRMRASQIVDHAGKSPAER